MKFLMATFLTIVFVVLFTTFTSSLISANDDRSQFQTVFLDIPGQGSILGNCDTTLWTKQTYMQFRGIPYAESPKGNLRFKAPVPRQPWRHNFAATSYGRRCPVITSVKELTENELQQDLEDCLNLCVYTKNLTAKAPVMFYIYGGGFYNGSSADHPPKYLLEKDIVLVVPHYRVGALGWLSAFTDDMPGNSPIGDLMMALQWVQDHISVFGGDPQQVTVFGQSAGAALTGALMLSPKTPTDSFKRAILQSGSIFGGWAINQNPREQVKRICRSLSCETCDSDVKLHDCLTQVSVKRLLEMTTVESFSPMIGDLNGILPQHPESLMKYYNRNISVMTGFTKHDGSFVLATYYDGMMQAIGNMSYVSVRKFAGGIMDFSDDKTCLTKHLLTRLLFTPKILESKEHKNAIPAYFDLTNAQFMKSPVITLASHLLDKRLAKVYLYSFDYVGEYTRFGYEFGNEHYPFEGGVHHSNDNIYLFSTHALNETDTEMAKKMVELWTSFAVKGTPDVNQNTNILPMEFENGPYFHINTNITIGYDVLQELTATVDDPEYYKLIREHIEF